MLPCLLALLALSCTERAKETQEQPAERTIRVAVGSGSRLGIESRTALADDGRKVVWSADDVIALWAFDGEGAAVLDGHPFRLWHYNAEYDSAKFTADIPEMAEGAYDYCAFYPVPDAADIDAGHVSYTVPAVQNGRYDPASNIMTACCSGGALVEGDNSDRVHLEFAHRVHLLEFTVPTCALGEAVQSLELEFPVAVAGRLTFDAADAGAEPVLTEGSNRLSLRFDEPLEAGAKACALIAPVEIPADRPVAIRAVGTTGESRTDTFGAGRRFAAGGVTPIEYNIPEMELHYTIIDFTLTNDGRTPNITLGEPVRTFTLSVDGGTFDNGLATRSFALADVAASATGERTFRMVFKEFDDNLSGKTVTVTYDSQHAAVSDSFVMPTLEAGGTNRAAKLEVPYLFEEDFSETTANNNNNHGSLSDTGHSSDIMWGDDCGLPGWSGNQFYVEPGKVLAIRHQTEKYMLLGTYRGRVDSKPIGGLKQSHKVHVSFNYDGRSTNKSIPVLNYGYTTDQQALFGYYEGGSAVIKGGTKIDNARSVNAALNGELRDLDPDTALKREFDIDGCTAEHRLSWDCFVESAASRNSQQWIFIDNIRVSIVNE